LAQARKNNDKIISFHKGEADMRKRSAWFAALLLMVLIWSCRIPEPSFSVPVEYHKLDNGLKIVLSPDDTAPTVIVAVYYNIGLRIEPKNRTGFAHLFEHMMFQGSKNLDKNEFFRLIQGQGGVLNASTRFDFTNFFEILPSPKLETALWAEADRMKGLAITQEKLTNQQGVVINEVKGAVLNRPYGGFPWLDMPQFANENWYNAHNFYGDIRDLAAATIEDVQAFFNSYYAPNNAALVVTGDFVPREALSMIKKYFGDVKPVERPEFPNIAENRQEKEKIFSKNDPLANKPAMAFSYHMPERFTPEFFAMGLLDQILLQGEDSLLYQALVKKEGLTGGVSGGINLLGNMFNYDGPMLWTASLFYDSRTSSGKIMSAVDSVMEDVRTKPIDREILDRARVKFRSALYDTMGGFYGFGRADLLACFALFDDNPAEINLLEEKLKAVTPELLLKTAQEYFRSANRTVLTINPKEAGQ
jgi:zinc protease